MKQKWLPYYVAGFIILLGIIGYFLQQYAFTLQITKKVPDGIACTLDAKMCPDGTAVGRIPPRCEFEECPVAKPQNTVHTPSGITGYADDPIRDEIAQPLTPSYIISHRSALNGKHVQVKGYVVSVVRDEDPCEGEPGCTLEPQEPRLIFADSREETTHQTMPFLEIIIREADIPQYPEKKTALATGTVTGDNTHVIVTVSH